MGRKKLSSLGKYRTKATALLVIFVYVFGLVRAPGVANAAVLTNRAIQISSAQPSIVTSYDFHFDIASTSSLGSIVLLFCDNSPVQGRPCGVPPGMNVAAANLALQSGNTGFSIDAGNTTANKLVLTRPTLAGLATTSDYKFTNVTNPGAPSHTEFVRISTYASNDGSGPQTDNGSVAFATVLPFNVSAFIPPFITFCVGIIVATDCSSTTGDSIDLGILSSAGPSSGQSQFSTATNDPSGYAVFVLGTTMTSGNNILPPLGSPLPSLAGTSQFGINLRGNTKPPTGSDRFGPGTGFPTTNYDFPNFFMFNSGDSVASSSLNSDFTRMTVSYLVNVAKSQLPGIYATTLTYVATASF